MSEVPKSPGYDGPAGIMLFPAEVAHMLRLLNTFPSAETAGLRRRLQDWYTRWLEHV